MIINELHILDKSKHGISAYQGFYFQHLNTLKKWLDNYINNKDNKIYCETNKDITEITNSNLKFEEIKFYALENTFTLNTQVLKETIFDFFLLFLKTKRINTRFIFYTNSKIGKTAKLLQSWANNNLLQKDKNELINKVYKILYDIKVQKTLHVYFDDNELTKENINNFIGRLKWNFENKDKKTSINQLLKEINNKINQIKHNEIDSNLYLGRLHWEVSKKSQNEEIKNRLLDNVLLNNILNEEYNFKFEDKIDIDFLNAINKGISDIRQTQEKAIIENKKQHQTTHKELLYVKQTIENIKKTETKKTFKNYKYELEKAKKLKKRNRFKTAINIYEKILFSDNANESDKRKSKLGITLSKKKQRKKQKRDTIIFIISIFVIIIIFSSLNLSRNTKTANKVIQEIDSLHKTGTQIYDSKIILKTDTAIFHYKKAKNTFVGFLLFKTVPDSITTNLEYAINLKKRIKNGIQEMINKQNFKDEIFQYLTIKISNGLRLFKFVPNGKFGYLNKNDSVVILPKFDYIRTTDKEIHFHNGKAKVCIKKDTFYINKKGNRLK